MTMIDKEAVRAANRLEEVIPDLTGKPLSRKGGRDLLGGVPFTKGGKPIRPCG